MRLEEGHLTVLPNHVDSEGEEDGDRVMSDGFDGYEDDDDAVVELEDRRDGRGRANGSEGMEVYD